MVHKRVHNGYNTKSFYVKYPIKCKLENKMCKNWKIQNAFIDIKNKIEETYLWKIKIYRLLYMNEVCQDYLFWHIMTRDKIVKEFFW